MVFRWRSTPHYHYKTNTCTFLKHQMNTKTLIHTKLCICIHSMPNQYSFRDLKITKNSSRVNRVRDRHNVAIFNERCWFNG